MGYKDFKKKHRDKIVLAILILLFIEFIYNMFCFLYLNNPQDLVISSFNKEIEKNKININNDFIHKNVISAYDLMPDFEVLNHKRDVNLFVMVLDSIFYLFIFFNEKIDKKKLC